MTTLSNDIKYYRETDPTDSDCDDDGLMDGAEPYWKEDNDFDGFINAWDQDSNDMISSPNIAGTYDMPSTSRVDFIQNYIIFRMGGRTGTNDNDPLCTFNGYESSDTWIAVDPNAHNTGKTPNGGVNLYYNEFTEETGTDNPLALQIFKTPSVVENTAENLGLEEMWIKYGDPSKEETIEEEQVLTPEGYRVLWEADDGDTNSDPQIYIEKDTNYFKGVKT